MRSNFDPLMVRGSEPDSVSISRGQHSWDLFSPKTFMNLLWQTKLTLSARYPERDFGRNKLLDGSISLLPLYPGRTTDLHFRTAIGLHKSFALPRRSSPSFGSNHTRSSSTGVGVNIYIH
ncbi:hypothetical protein XENOCAPTIV_015254 [Xenoophorus captivus]|uniref:Uncharacterized protein n=1 Tax=Xenoophorus captivus TaxID=1517983 RepID=A0ABV0SFH4_9TELE